MSARITTILTSALVVLLMTDGVRAMHIPGHYYGPALLVDVRGWWQSSPGGGVATRVYSDEGIVIDKGVNPFLRYDIAVDVTDDTAGLFGVFFDVEIPQAAAAGYFLDPTNLADAGYNNFGGPPTLRSVAAPAFDVPQPSSGTPNYGGGWGFGIQGHYSLGLTAQPGTIDNIGVMMPGSWSGDNAPGIQGLQSYSLLGIGVGEHVGNENDPILAGTTLGFGYDMANVAGTGDGSWIVMSGLIDTTSWAPGEYDVHVIPNDASSYLQPPYPGIIDYDLPHQPVRTGSFGSVWYPPTNLFTSPFSFTIIPEPAALAMMVLGALGLIRRRAS